MIDLSLAGLIGAFIGTAAAAFAYAPLVSSIERQLRARTAAESGENVIRQEIVLLRRGVLAADIVVFAGLGYWLGTSLAGA